MLTFQSIKYLMLIQVCSFFLLSTVFAQAPDTLWTKTFGGSDYEYGHSVQQTSDGGFIVTGQVDAEIAQPQRGDVWLLRVNSVGDSLWTRRFGGSDNDEGISVQQTFDGGFIVAGNTASFGAGNRDAWLIRTDANGDTLWTKTYGGAGADYARSVQQTSDGGFIVVGYTSSFGAGISDAWLIRTNANGDTLWTKTFGSPAGDQGNSVQQTADGGFIVTGRFFSVTAGAADLWLIRTDANGDSLWTKTYNGRYYPYSWDDGKDVQLTADGGFIIVGETNGLPNTTNTNVWLLRTADNGDTLWTKQYGGTALERAYSLQQTSDGGFIVAGFRASNGLDAFIIRTNSTGDSLWSKTLGGTGNDQANAISKTNDGGFIVTGFTYSYGAGKTDLWLIRLDFENLTAFGNPGVLAPNHLQLLQNYPNPFNPTTSIGFRVSNFGFVSLQVYDLLGKVVASLVNESLAPGGYQVQWKGRDDTGQLVASGVYLYRLQTKDFIQTKKLILLH